MRTVGEGEFTGVAGSGKDDTVDGGKEFLEIDDDVWFEFGDKGVSGVYGSAVEDVVLK